MLQEESVFRTFPVILLTLALAAGCAAPPAPEEPLEWPQWRGATGMGLAGGGDLPEAWGPDAANVRWRTDIPGSGNSSPVVARGRVFLTTSYEDPGAEEGASTRRSCLAVDFETGRILWETAVVTTPKEARHWMTTGAAPTPATDGSHVYVYFGSHLAALDLDGRVVWTKEVEPDYAKYSRYSAASSPILTDAAVVVAQDQESGKTDDVGWIAAFDKATGEQIWRREWDDTCCSYSTPLWLDRGSERRLLFARSGAVAEYDPATGDELWIHTYEINQMVSSLVAEGDLLCIAGGAHNVRRSTCVSLTGHGRQTKVEVLWESLQGPPETSSPVLVGGLLFTVTNKGVLSCIDARSGEAHWRKRLAGGGYHASLVAGGGKIYVPNVRGLTSVVAAQPEYRLIGENGLDEGGFASPAAAGGSLLFRTKSQLVRVDKEAPGGDS